MKRTIGISLVVAQLMVFWFAVAQTRTSSPVPTALRAGSDSRSPLIAISPVVLNFGLVGVGRTKDLPLTVQNAGGGRLEGTATVAAPFSIVGARYSLKSGQSQSLTVRYKPTAPGTNTQSVVLGGASAATVLVTGSARTPPPPPGNLRITRFAEEEQANFIVWYYSDQTSYVLKPAMMDGQFRAICDRDLVLKLAAQQPRRELAVVVLIHYPNSASEEPVKLGWVNDLKRLGYQHTVFLRGGNKMEVKDLPVLEGPQVTAMPVEK